MDETEQLDLLVVDDDAEYRSTVVRRFARRGHRVSDAADGETALALGERRQFDVAIIDLVMPGLSGLDVLQRLKASQPDCEIILLTGQGTVETAVQAMKLSAYDFITKPCPLAELEVLVEKAAQRRRLSKENKQLREVIRRSQPRSEMIGESPPMRELMRLIERAAPTDKAILIQGESGSGKELVARALHRASALADKPLVVINCAALPESLLESELFGHEKGAFTGAVQAKQGLFEVADGGTLFIDEVGELPGSLQAKLLRVLEDGSMRRVGSVKEQRVSVRLLAATNREMAEAVRSGQFREDLYYRINVMSLLVPPLRERAGDIPLLVKHFLGPEWSIAPQAMEVIERYRWPGNVRQLVNAIERGKIVADDRTIRVKDLPREIQEACGIVPSGGPSVIASSDQLADVERAHIIEVLRRERGNKARTARVLGLNRRSLYRLIEKYDIQIATPGANPV